jgi:hypothetical protein
VRTHTYTTHSHVFNTLTRILAKSTEPYVWTVRYCAAERFRVSECDCRATHHSCFLMATLNNSHMHVPSLLCNAGPGCMDDREGIIVRRYACKLICITLLRKAFVLGSKQACVTHWVWNYRSFISQSEIHQFRSFVSQSEIHTNSGHS